MDLNEWPDESYVVDSVHADEREDGAGYITIQKDIRYGARSRKTVAIQIVDGEGTFSSILTVYASDLLRAVKAAKLETL